MTDAPNYYRDALHAANRGAVMEDALDTLKAAQRELDELHWRVEQADSYGAYMRHAVHTIPFSEWIARRRAMSERMQQERVNR